MRPPRPSYSRPHPYTEGKASDIRSGPIAVQASAGVPYETSAIRPHGRSAHMATGTAPALLDRVTKELAVVNAKLEAAPAHGSRRLELLRRQASLGDVRDAAVEAARRGSRAPVDR